MFFVAVREEKGKKMITRISGFGFFCPKMAVSWLRTVFHKMGCWNPYFYSVFLGTRIFWPSCQKKGNFGHLPKKGKFRLIIEKFSFFGFFFFVFFWFFCSLFSFLCLIFCILFVIFWGSGEVAQRVTSLGPKPSKTFFCFFVFVLFLFWRV